MTLQEMSVDYWRQAKRLNRRIQALRQQEKRTEEPLEKAELHGRVRALTVLWRESQELAEHLEHYYERGYRRNGKYTI